MAENSKIEWTIHTANLWHGCTKVHEGCDNCYACNLSKRYGHNVWGNENPRRAIKSVWDDLKKFQQIAQKSNEVHTVFVGSMMDIFEKPMPLIDHKKIPMEGITTHDLRLRFFNEVIPSSPNLMFLLLTKRPSNINKYIPEHWKENPPSNVMFGTSPVSQKTFDNLVPHLKGVNGNRFLSVEPQLEDIINIDLTGIDWVIQGGESGGKKRPFNTDWARRTRDYCKDNNVPYFFKQVDKVKEIPDDLMVREFPFIN
jgi:protein gp37